MKKVLILLFAFTLSLSASIASDVGTDIQLQTCQFDMQHTSLLSAMFTPAIALTTPVVCIAQDTQFTASGFLAVSVRPESFIFIDQGSCCYVGDNCNRQIKANYSNGRYLKPPTNYHLPSTNYLPTARHV